MAITAQSVNLPSDSSIGKRSHPNSSNSTATTCVAILSLPSGEAGMISPRVKARLRSPVTANSRPMITATIQAGASSSCTSDTSVAEMSSLSAIGSSTCPTQVIC